MSKEIRDLYEERLGRYQATIALEKTDRMPVATGSNYFAEVYSGNTNQETIYDSEKWLKAEEIFIRDFPEVDVLRNNRIWAPLYDAVGCKTYKLPGRDLPSKTQFQFVEEEYMKADEYDILINDPVEFMMDRFLPRVLGDMAEPGSTRCRMAFLKGGMAQMMMAQVMRNRSIYLQEKLGMPQPMTGAFVAPFDVLADAMRGLRGILLDIYRQPDKVLEACDVIVHEIAHFALSTADPLKRYPIFVPTHKACFLSPKQFETFYWPSFKKTLEILINAGYTVRAYLEGDWGHHWHHFLELPKGKLILDIDNQGDIFKAYETLGKHQCLAGGIPDSMFILGTPQEMKERVKLLCETVGKEGGFIINGGCNIPYDTKPENYRAMIDAIIEYGTYDSSYKCKPKVAEPGSVEVEALNKQRMVTPWEKKLEELGNIMGEEDLIRRPWEMLESMGYNWMWQWVM
ncbi:uroporphyrinogen decarboxylase family protein [Desulfoscipio geothermicus]|uniref:Uroporphyrinogen-III decarboxylase n=1 Tax=Desulfoscipio geothermicus DSM 3669 TaxID=1121426 RepID=A0A1I6EIJ4_9FIRM|nr:uroporphyrinogen decarboxylase family protein [Desulfoscipio geothermicus]SFR17586.1 Uroporphyrinogen-III decarboxylase [Desulfoscipio geothermicus DSM 3669]